MIITAHLHTLRIAPRKVRLVARALKGMDVLAAQHHLRYLPKRSSAPLAKLINSALANGSHNHGLVRENMRIQDIRAEGGPVLKRFRPKGFGSASPIARRTSHVTVILEEKVPGLRVEKKVITEEKRGKIEKREEVKHEVKKAIGKKEGVVKRFTRKFFRRKSV